MAEESTQAVVEPVSKPLNLIPVGLKEAALDSPTFRATSLHFADNIEAVERWLDGYVKAASKLVAEVSSLEAAVNSFLGQSTPPAQISEAVLDHDYTLLALRRYGEGAREFWQSTLRGIKRYDTAVVDPIKSFLNNDLRSFKEARRTMDAAQKSFDTVISRYSSQSKTKESSSLREDAFQLHEARKMYLKSSMDFCVQAPQLRASLDKLIVRIFAEQWKEMRNARESSSAAFARLSGEMDRVRGWSREMENSERAFKRELLAARRQIEDNAEQMTRPSRELEDYSASTVPFLGGGTAAREGLEKSEKQGWLFLKSITGKPARTVWSRRWFFVKNGIFGWLVQGTRSGGVEESEKIGVLLCSVRPAFQEERRFCFEVKTKDQSIILQAETQQELTEWISAFEVAKRKALEDPASTEASSQAPGIDPAFAISPPVAPEFAAKITEGHQPQGSEGDAGLNVPDREGSGLPNRASFDVNPGRRVMSLEREPDSAREGTRDRIMQKLDLHKRSNAPSQTSNAPAPGGIASLISASHNILPVGPGSPQPIAPDGPRRNLSMPISTLAPSTLAAPPAATNLSHTAVVVSGERGVTLSRADGSSIPSGILGNVWGSSNWGYVNRLGEEPKPRKQSRPTSQQSSSPAMRSVSMSQDDSIIMDGMNEPPKEALANPNAPSPGHRKNMSIGTEKPQPSLQPSLVDEYPNYYPLPLKAQNAQFRMLFPNVPKDEKLCLVFRATWNPNEQQEFPGRVYVTTREIYFFSNHLGLVLITGVSLSSIGEVTAAPGRDCDFLYLHLKSSSVNQDDPRRITVKVFLEPLRLLQRRLNFLVSNADVDEPLGLEETLKTLIKMEVEEPKRSSSVESWEDIAYDADEARDQRAPDRQRGRNIKASLRIDGNLYGETAKTGREIQKFKLPAQPVVYAPQGMQASVSREFNVSAKALFHVMFGDKSAVFQLLYANRWADKIVQTPWTKASNNHWTRKFTSHNQATPMADTQVIDIYNDHLCYVVTNEKYPWRLPFAASFSLTTKFVITHSAKSRCKLAIFQSLAWIKPAPMAYIKRLIEKQAFNSLEADALDLTTVAMDQVAKLGNHSKTNKAVEIFGSVGSVGQQTQIDRSQVPSDSMPAIAHGDQHRPLSMWRLIANDLFARLLGVLSFAFDLVVAVAKGVVGVCTAHTFLIVVLAVSAMYNSWHGYRDGMTWYHDRSATRFMNRIGITPDPRLSKAVYLSDVNELVAPANETEMAPPVDETGKTCRTTFSEQLLTSSTSVAPTNAAGARLYRSRESLARYRHDLLVALRVVNRVEKDVVLAEWEEWIHAEERKCARVERMLQRRKDRKGGGKAALEEELGGDFAEYCDSCRRESEELRAGNATSLWLI